MHPRTKAGNVRVPHGRAPPMAPDKTDACCALAAAPDKTSANVHIGAQSVHRAAPKAKNGQNERECATALPKTSANVHIRARSVQKKADPGVPVAHSRSKCPDFPDSDARWTESTRMCSNAERLGRVRESRTGELDCPSAQKQFARSLGRANRESSYFQRGYSSR